MTSHSSQQIKATLTSFKIIDVVKQREPVRLTPVAEEVDLSKSAVHKHLSTLESLGYISKNDGKYGLGLGFLNLGGHVQQNFDLYQAARKEVNDLAERTGETAILMALDGYRATYIYVCGDNEGLIDDAHVGSQIDLYSSPSGRTILAHLSPELVEQIVETIDFPIQGDKDTLNKQAFQRRLDEIKDRGHAFRWAPDVDDLQSVTAPVIDSDDKAIGAVTILGPSTRVDGKRLEVDITGSVLSKADKISRKIAET